MQLDLRHWRRAAVRLGAAVAVLLAAGTAHAASSSDPDWPCIQRKVPQLSIGQMWSGPEAVGDWRADPEIALLANRIASRRTDLTEVEALVDGFAAESGAERSEKLSLLYSGVFQLIDRDRSQVIGGISRYTTRQRALADRIRDETLKLADLKAAPPADTAPPAAAAPTPAPAVGLETGGVVMPGGIATGGTTGPIPAAQVPGVVVITGAAPPIPDTIPELERALTWDTRIYEERERSLTYVCEVPVLFEQRAFAISRIIQGKLGGQ